MLLRVYTFIRKKKGKVTQSLALQLFSEVEQYREKPKPFPTMVVLISLGELPLQLGARISCLECLDSAERRWPHLQTLL